ncbi:MAG TPA: helix-turn-helix transcriptional regulator [Blastocatellia bacterium]|nr:helix-turn-helix transcriptional regulator [Blastocatellia bacterium]HMX27461.1 helix-turn-helix transcriptional regulator [Blastocatellia bacterium]HMY75476.1 helix-turn-helix transcriptional regulator [Blastocatellia bacterium]HMZ21453.1 helix-turn-helix transcriptional regulator [Blastocatellia bacterium]HNG33267.1 helix-turn-helix transcriptional regulator [Blastocatellia bacterium]
MTGQDLLAARAVKKWNQKEAAGKLGVSQPYLSLLENGGRPVPAELAAKAVRVYGLSHALLPMRPAEKKALFVAETLPALDLDLAALGYPGFSYLTTRRPKKNPAEVLFAALGAKHLDSRVIEALPWIVWRFPELDWQWLTDAARLNDLQNRLGFVVNIARRLAERGGEREKAALFAQQERALEFSRLVSEDTLCHDLMTVAERRWLRKNRSPQARHWRLLTDLSPEHLDYAR